MSARALENGGPLGDDQSDDVSAHALTLSPVFQAQSAPQAEPGSLNLTASLVILAGLVSEATVIVVVCCSRP